MTRILVRTPFPKEALESNPMLQEKLDDAISELRQIFPEKEVIVLKNGDIPFEFID